MNSTLETIQITDELPKKICVLRKKRILKDGSQKEYIYNQSKYNDTYYAKNKERIQCPCGGFYMKSSAFTHRQRSKAHHKYLESIATTTNE